MHVQEPFISGQAIGRAQDKAHSFGDECDRPWPVVDDPLVAVAAHTWVGVADDCVHVLLVQLGTHAGDTSYAEPRGFQDMGLLLGPDDRAVSRHKQDADVPLGGPITEQRVDRSNVQSIQRRSADCVGGLHGGVIHQPGGRVGMHLEPRQWVRRGRRERRWVHRWVQLRGCRGRGVQRARW